MSTKSFGDGTITEGSIVSSTPIKCRIPQRLPVSSRNPKFATAKVPLSNEPPARRGVHASSVSPGRMVPNTPRSFRSRPHSTESARPKSNRKEEASSVKSSVAAAREQRMYMPERESAQAGNRSSPMPMPVRKVNINNLATPSKLKNSNVVTVPLTQKTPPTYRGLFRNELPSQDTIKRFEELALKHGISDIGVNATELAAGNLSVDVTKLYNIPNMLVSTCEQTLAKRKEIIDWFERLRHEEKGISMNKLAKKVTEFNAENEMLNSTLLKVKTEFLKEISEIIECVGKSLNDTIALQLRTEDMMYEITELNSQNADLRKQIQAADHYKSPHIRRKLEEAEKELKEEKCEKMLIKKRLARAEGQVKIGQERAEQLEMALQQAKDRMWDLENSLKQQNEQHQKLQNDFDQELNNLTESIRDNTAHVEEIAKAREKLQIEKEDLEKRLLELGESYRDSLELMKQEVNKTITKLAESENKFEEEKAKREKLQSQLESLCAQLVESELRYKDTLKILQEKDVELNTKTERLKELEATKQQLEMANKEIEENRNILISRNETIKDIEQDLKNTIVLESELRNKLTLKEHYVCELEMKNILLTQQIHESERKMTCYEEQSTFIKDQITELKDDFGDFKNFHEFREIVSKQRTKLTETIKRNSELEDQLQKKQSELYGQMETLTKITHKLEQKEALVKKLREKEEEQAKIVKLLRNNVEIRTEAENEFIKQLAEKDTEIHALKDNIDARKQQISQLEKIVLALEDQVRNLNNKRNIDQDKITLLEKMFDSETSHNEAQHHMEVPSDNLDNLIRILEDELDSPFEPCIREQDYNKKKYTERIRQEKLAKFEAHTKNENTSYQIESEKMPTKIVMGNFVKKTYNIPNHNQQYKGDNVDSILDRKKTIRNMEPCFDNTDDNMPPTSHKQPSSPIDGTTGNLHFYFNNQVEKKCKMFRFAGHRL